MVAKAQDGYRFIEWDKVDNDSYTKIANSSYGTKYGIIDVTVGYASTPVTSSNKCSDKDTVDTQAHTDINYMYTTNATFFAKFEPLPDASQRAVIAKVNNALYGSAGVYPVENIITDDVKLFVVGASDLHNRLGYEKKFLGWEKDGVIVSKDTILSLKINNENQGTYTAIFEDGYKFHRIRNRNTGNYLTAVNDQGSLTNLSALKLIKGLGNVICDAGSIIEIEKGEVYNNKKTSKRTYYNYIVQGADAIPFYDFKYDDPNGKNPYTPDGVFVRMPYNASYNDWLFSTDDVGSTRLRDNKGTPSFTALETPETEWYIEPMDKDLETKENYFSLDPAKLIQLGEDEYYTTLRTSWDILFDPEQMTPYVVTSVVDELNGTFEMEPLEGNIIPKGTPVIIKTKSTDIEENRMVPIISNATKPTVNELTSSEKYFPDQSVSTSSNYKKLMVKDGQLAFGDDALNTVNGNEAYLCVANDVILPNITLADLLKRGDTEKTYSVTDLTCVYARDNVLYCKDDDGARNRSKMEDGEIDYLVTVAGLQTKPWDQSNWIAVKLPSKAGSSYFDHRLTNVVGRLTNVVNPELEVTALPTVGAENPYSENTYITCNFSGSHQENVTINGVEHNYYFVEPKPMEIANVKWALWNGETFSKPSNASSDLKGEFAANFSFSGEPSSAGVYNFPALIKIAPTAQGVMPRAQDEATKSWLVFPLELTNQPVTAIDSLQSGKTTVKVVYYNLMGVESAVPHNGINIVETRYSDGTRTTTKIIR